MVDDPERPRVVHVSARDRAELLQAWVWRVPVVRQNVPAPIRRAIWRFLGRMPEETQRVIVKRSGDGWSVAAHLQDSVVGLVLLRASGRVVVDEGRKR